MAGLRDVLAWRVGDGRQAGLPAATLASGEGTLARLGFGGREYGNAWARRGHDFLFNDTLTHRNTFKLGDGGTEPRIAER